MKILLISATDSLGGASLVAYALGKDLISNGHEVTFLVGKSLLDEEWIEEIQAPEPFAQKLTGKLIHRSGLNQFNLNCRFPFSYGIRYFKQFDIVHLHDLPNNFNLLFGLPYIARVVPTVWTLHSMWPITGGCGFSYDCEKWKASCGACPQFGKWPLKWLHRDASRASIRLKRFIYSLSPISLIAVSRWLLDCATSATFQRHPAHFIPNAPDEAFYPMARKEAREKLGIPEDKFVIMFSVSGNPEDKRKGIDLIEAALGRMNREKVYLLPTGITPLRGQMENIARNFDGRAMQHILSRDVMRDYYNAADVVWSPTRADNCPMALLEAMACSTPCIAANVGGVPEVLNNGNAGILIPADNSTALASETEKLIENPGLRKRFSEEAKSWLEKEYSRSQFYERHVNVYTRMKSEAYD